MKTRMGPVLAAAALSGCLSDYEVTLHNSTTVPLQYYPVVTDPPPPHRELSSRVFDPDTSGKIDAEDFNPAFYDPVSHVGFFVQMALEAAPRQILVRVFQFQVPPGQEGGDPALQPQSLQDYLLEVQEGNETLGIRAGPVSANMPITFTQEP